jgi:hypothetical protein
VGLQAIQRFLDGIQSLVWVRTRASVTEGANSLILIIVGDPIFPNLVDAFTGVKITHPGFP